MNDHAFATSALLMGIDVAKDKLDLARSDSPVITTVTNDAPSIAQLVKAMRPFSPLMTAVRRRLIPAPLRLPALDLA